MKRKILMVTGIFPPDIGGPATYVPQIAKSLAQRGHQITVVTLSDRLDHDDSCYPFKVVRLPRSMGKLWRWLRTMLAIIRIGCDSEVLFVNGLALEAMCANLFLRKPLVMKVVGDHAWERSSNRGWVAENFEDFQKKRYGLKVEMHKSLRSWWTRRAHRIIVPSHYLACWLSSCGVPEEKITVIYNALEPVNGVTPGFTPLNTPLKAITVSRLVPWKGIDRIIEVIARLDDLGLIVVGEGPERPRLEALAKHLGITERLFFAGQRSKSETLSLMAAADLFVLNSSYEGLPHVVLEAMSLGVPVVATTVGGTPELVRHGKSGLLINYGDLKGLHDAIALLISDASQREFLALGGKTSLKPFEFRQMLDRTEALLGNSNL